MAHDDDLTEVLRLYRNSVVEFYSDKITESMDEAEAKQAILQKYISRKEVGSKVDKAKEMLAAQGVDGNWDYNPYMHGLYNGMEFIIAILEDREPDCKEPPKQWIADIKTKNASNLGHAMRSMKGR